MPEHPDRAGTPKTAAVPATPPEEDATGDHGPRGTDASALVAGDEGGERDGDPLMDDPRPKG